MILVNFIFYPIYYLQQQFLSKRKKIKKTCSIAHEWHLSGSCSFYLAGITGLSDIFIETLEIVGGSESIIGECLNQEWSGTFNMAIASMAVLSVDNLGAGFQASGCGTSVTDGL